MEGSVSRIRQSVPEPRTDFPEVQLFLDPGLVQMLDPRQIKPLATEKGGCNGNEQTICTHT